MVGLGVVADFVVVVVGLAVTAVGPLTTLGVASVVGGG
jgi:hypothetical protein